MPAGSSLFNSATTASAGVFNDRFRTRTATRFPADASACGAATETVGSTPSGRAPNSVTTASATASATQLELASTGAAVCPISIAALTSGSSATIPDAAVHSGLSPDL